MELNPLLFISENVSIKQAWRQLDENGYKILLVTDKTQKLLGSVTDGDIRRWILQDKSVTEPISNVMCVTPVVVTNTDSPQVAKKLLLDHRIDCVPVVDENLKVIKLIFWDDIFRNGEKNIIEKMNVPLVVMAGGRGTRLDPYTKILPKPLVPIGDKPIIEEIMDRFDRYGISRFFISINYKSEMIKAYFQERQLAFKIDFVKEETPSGTAGSLSLLKGQIKDTFFVTNCDVLVNANYADILKFHREQKNKITLVCSMKHFTIPYGVVDIGAGGSLKGIVEKPEHDHLVLTGVYVLEPELIELIPQSSVFHITHLIEKIHKEGLKVGVYPVADRAWVDIGELDHYQEALKNIRF